MTIYIYVNVYICRWVCGVYASLSVTWLFTCAEARSKRLVVGSNMRGMISSAPGRSHPRMIVWSPRLPERTAAGSAVPGQYISRFFVLSMYICTSGSHTGRERSFIARLEVKNLQAHTQQLLPLFWIIICRYWSRTPLLKSRFRVATTIGIFSFLSPPYVCIYNFLIDVCFHRVHMYMPHENQFPRIFRSRSASLREFAEPPNRRDTPRF